VPVQCSPKLPRRNREFFELIGRISNESLPKLQRRNKGLGRAFHMTAFSDLDLGFGHMGASCDHFFLFRHEFWGCLIKSLGQTYCHLCRLKNLQKYCLIKSLGQTSQLLGEKGLSIYNCLKRIGLINFRLQCFQPLKTVKEKLMMTHTFIITLNLEFLNKRL
jgi:hypothetical protein